MGIDILYPFRAFDDTMEVFQVQVMKSIGIEEGESLPQSVEHKFGPVEKKTAQATKRIKEAQDAAFGSDSGSWQS